MSDEKKLAIIVEDDVLTSEIFEAAIKEAGYRTEVYNDGQAALDRLQTYDEVPFLAVLDLHLPNVPGDMILDHIVQDEQLQNLRVIVASADGSLAKFQQGKKSDHILIMQKPVSFEQLKILSMRMMR